MNEANGSSATGRQTIVEEGSELSGKLASKVDVVVRGRVDGELSAPSLCVSPSGAVHGTVRVGSLRSEGEVSGDIEADSVQLAGAVRDNTVIRAKSLEVKLAADAGKLELVFGECELNVGDAPADERASNKKSAPRGKGKRSSDVEPAPTETEAEAG
jgi:cytoskeletal protein CcmA (bactofilin family)